jgi:hypothetical protein
MSAARPNNAYGEATLGFTGAPRRIAVPRRPRQVLAALALAGAMAAAVTMHIATAGGATPDES